MVSSWRLLSLSTFCKCSGLRGTVVLAMMVIETPWSVTANMSCDFATRSRDLSWGCCTQAWISSRWKPRNFMEFLLAFLAFPCSCFVFVTGFHESWLCNIEALPQVIGVLTHLDSFKENKQLRKVLLSESTNRSLFTSARIAARFIPAK